MEKTVDDGDTETTTKFIYDGFRVIAEYDGGSTLLRKYVYNPGIDEPLASFTVSPNPVCVGSPVSFDATDSYDPDCELCDSCGGVNLVNGISKFEWDWTNDENYDESESPESAGDEDAAKTSHIYSSAGVFTCKLRVTDNDDGCCCSECADQTKTTTVTITVVEVTKVEAGGKETGETLYLAGDYLDEPDKREEKQQTVVATLNPSVSPPDNFCWTPACGESLPTICPDDTASATFTAKDPNKYTITAACCNSSKSMYIAIEGVNIKTANIDEADEMTKSYNIFLNEDFDQQLDAADEPGHADCLLPDNDNSDDTLTGDDMSEIGEINFTAETHEDPGATVYFTSSSIIKLYDSEKNKLDFGYNNKYDPNDLGSTLYVEGIAEGTTTLTATLTTGDEFTATDSILIKVIGLDFKAVNRLPSAEDPHEICYRDKLIILVNDNDSNANGESDLNDTTIPGGDPDLAMISLFKPNATEEDVPGNITVTFPGNVNIYRKSDKSIGPISSFSEPLSYFTDPNNPTYMHQRVDFFLEGKTASSAILDQHVKVDMTLDSGVKCEDEIHYTVLKSDMILHNGLEGWSGGQVLAEQDEEVKGAVTVANLNDTDSDGGGSTKDIDDSVVAGEKDLMKIILEQPKPNTLPGKVRIRIASGDVKIYSDSTKAGGEVTLEQPVSAFSADSNGNNNNDLVWWVEARSASSLKGIDLRYEYQPSETADWIQTDKVRATAVWVNCTNVWHERAVNPEPGPEKDIPNLDDTNLLTKINVQRIAQDGSRYGIGTHSVSEGNDTMIGGRILFEFAITPNSTDSHLLNGVIDLGVTFDITRQTSRILKVMVSGLGGFYSVQGWPDLSYPTDDESPNDDSLNGDEDSAPKNMYIYSWDAPSSGINPGVIAFDIKRYNFLEWVRIQLDGASFTNNDYLVEGSRASYKTDWHHLGYLRRGLNGKFEHDVLNPSYSGPYKTGTGNGTCSVTLLANAGTEGFTATYDEPNKKWTLTGTAGGSISDIKNPAPQGTQWTLTLGTRLTAIITQGSTAFANGDTFKFCTFKSTATNGKQNKIDPGQITVNDGP